MHLLAGLEEIAISKLKAICLAVLERMQRTGSPVRVTRFGQPAAEVVPATPPERSGDWLGALRATGSIEGDIVAPVVTERDWEALGR
jgi:antitoxin (DNA-binding transcriptional repressor) of toxin-antitoxin stability system